MGLIAAVLLGQGTPPNWALGLCAIAGALIITLILLRFARRHLSTSRLLLAGVALGIICSALMTWAINFSTSVDLRQLMYWMMGGFGGVVWRQSWLMLALIPVLLWICCQSRPMNMLALGEIGAATGFTPVVLAQCAGLASDRLDRSASVWRWRVLSALLVWLIPHILRLCGLTDHRVLLPGCALAGAKRIAAWPIFRSAPGISCRRAANFWRGHRNVGCAGVYLVIVKSKTLAAKRRSMIKS